MLKKIWKFLSSMTFAIILLALLCAACAGASFLPQGETFEWYAAAYSETAAAWIIALQLNDAFHSWWFIAIAAFLCANLLLCNVLRLKGLVQRTKSAADPARAIRLEPDAAAAGIAQPRSVFRRLGMPNPSEHTVEDRTVLLSGKNRVGLWGAWVCHVGILLLILGFGLGQFTKAEYFVYGVPGQTKPIDETGLMLTIDDFRIGLREDDTVEQYTAEIRVQNAATGEEQRAAISVNHPGRLFGMSFYQNATGWAARISVEKDGVPLQSEVVCAGEVLPIADQPALVIYFSAFYPDYVYVPGEGPRTASGLLNHPAYLYAVYYNGELIGMNVLEADDTIRIDGDTEQFSDPQSYTLLQIKRDSFTWLALIGGLVTLIGLLLAFYVLPQTVWAVLEEDGTWTVSGVSAKRRTMLREELQRAADEAKAGQ